MKHQAIVLSMCASVLLAGCASDSALLSEPQPDRAAAINLEMAVEYLRKGDLAQAKEKLDRSLEQNPRSASAQVTAGLLYDRLGEGRKADDHFQRAISLAPQDPDIQNNYAVFLCQKGRYRRGEKYALEAAANPLYRTPEAGYVNAGNCARNAGNLKQAEENYRQALRVNARFGEALLRLADLKLHQTEYLPARAFLERYLAVGRTSAATLWLGVRIERGLGNAATAQHYARRLKSEYPGSAQARALLESERNPG